MRELERRIGHPPAGAVIPAEQAVRQGECHLRSVLDALLAFVGVMTPDGVLIEANRPVLAVAGVRPEDVLGRPFEECYWWSYSPDVQQQVRESIHRAAAGEVVRCDVPLRAAEGRLITVDLSIVPLRDEHGRVTHLITSAVDITERERLELSLEGAHRRLQFHVENTPLAVVEWGSDFVITRWSREAERLFGWTADEVVGKRIDAFPLIYPPDIPGVERVMARMLDGTSPSNVNRNRNLTKSGSVVHCEWYNSSLRDGSGQLLSVLSLVLDVTERKHLEESLFERAREIETLMNVAPVAIWIGHDPACTRITGNALGAQILRSELDQNLSQTAPPDERPAFTIWRNGAPFPTEELPMQYAASHRVDVRDSELEIRFPDGTVRYVFGNASPFYDAHGNVRGAVGTFLDVTERKRRENEIAALNERLRRAMRETHHRVKNNLQTISALVDMQALGATESVPLSEWRRIGQQTQVLAAIHDLLTREAQDDTGVTVSAQTMLDRLVPVLQAVLGSRALHLDADAVPLTSRQATSLGVLVNELVSNSAKHGAQAVYVSLSARGMHACLQVADDGPGFPPGFDPVRDANTGIELVESLGRWDLQGEVAYANRPEGGACVVVTFCTAPGAQPTRPADAGA